MSIWSRKERKEFSCGLGGKGSSWTSIQGSVGGEAFAEVEGRIMLGGKLGAFSRVGGK